MANHFSSTVDANMRSYRDTTDFPSWSTMMPPIHLQAILFGVLIDQVKQLATQIVVLHQVAELAARGLIRHRRPAGIAADAMTHGTGVMQIVIDSRIEKIEPMLEKIDAQHSLNADRASATPSGFG